MFNKLKVALAATATVGALALAGTSTAQASVHVGSEANRLNQTGSMALNATAPSSRLVLNGNLALNCAITAGAGSINTGLYSAFPATIGTIQPIFGAVGQKCVGPSGFLFTVSCAATSDLNLTVGTGTNTFAGSITGISCTINFDLGCSALATGSVQGSYTNPATPSTNGRLTIFTAGQSLTVSGSTCPAAVLPNGTAVFGGTGGTPLAVTDLVYTVSGSVANQPFLTQT